MNFRSDLDRCSKNLVHLCEKQQMSVDALAALSGVPKEAINNFEQGKGHDMAVGNLLKIAEVLNIEFNAIFGKNDRQ